MHKSYSMLGVSCPGTKIRKIFQNYALISLVLLILVQNVLVVSADKATSTSAGSTMVEVETEAADDTTASASSSPTSTVSPPLSSSSSMLPGKKRIARQENFYNYRTDYDDDRNYAYFEGDTAGNYVSDFGLRTNRPSARVAGGVNPFEIFGNNEGRSGSRSGGGRSRNNNIGSRIDNVGEDDDYLLDDGQGQSQQSTSSGDDYYDDYPEQQDYQYREDVIGRRLDNGRGYHRSRNRGGGGSGGGGGGWSGSSSFSRSNRPGDASYSFGYSLIDQSRYEYSDPYGNINGYYSYVDDDGVLRHVSYTAGAYTGFVVNQNRLHQHPYHRYRPSSIPQSPPPSRVKVSIGGGSSIGNNNGGGGWEEEEEDVYQPPTQGHRIPSSPPPQRRPTSSTAAQGGWPGRRRRPSYVVKIRRPIKPAEPPAWIYYRPPNPGRPAPGRGTSSWRPPQRRPPSQRPTQVYPPDEEDGGGGGGGGGWSDSDQSVSPYPKDASYHFAYDAGSHNRNEFSDPWGNVRGSYSYIDPDGVRRTVHYSAGSATGFKILSASPSQMVNRIYKDPPLPIPASMLSRLRPRPSAIVYHLHADGGWKPWEGSETNIISKRPRTKTDNKNDEASPTSYQYQRLGPAADDDEIQMMSTEDSTQPEPLALDPRAVDRKGRKMKTRGRHGEGWKPSNDHNHHHHHHSERRQQQYKGDLEVEPIYDQEYSNDGKDDEYQIVADTKYEPLKTNMENGKVMTITGYKGGYGDKNPLLVMSESSSQPRESSRMMMMKMSRGGGMYDHDDNMGMNMMNNNPSSTTRPISVARLMSMRMSKSRKMMKIKSTSKINSRSSSSSSSSTSKTDGSGMNSNNSNNHSRRRRKDDHHQSESSSTKRSTSTPRNSMMMNMLTGSSISQSQSYNHDDGDDEVQVQAPPVALQYETSPHQQLQQQPQMMIMSQERRLAHYPKSYNKNMKNMSKNYNNAAGAGETMMVMGRNNNNNNNRDPERMMMMQMMMRREMSNNGRN